MNSYDAIKESRTWLPSTGPHPILKKLKEGKENNEAGWLRKEVKKALKLPSTPIGQFEMTEVAGLDSLRYDTHTGCNGNQEDTSQQHTTTSIVKVQSVTCFENIISTMIRTTYLQ